VAAWAVDGGRVDMVPFLFTLSSPSSLLARFRRINKKNTTTQQSTNFGRVILAFSNAYARGSKSITTLAIQNGRPTLDTGGVWMLTAEKMMNKLALFCSEVVGESLKLKSFVWRIDDTLINNHGGSAAVVVVVVVDCCW
jgi:hypothetical protein